MGGTAFFALSGQMAQGNNTGKNRSTLLFYRRIPPTESADLIITMDMSQGAD
jgi:hypothetical protein